MNTKRFTTLVLQASLISGFAVSFPFEANAQFKKYKSKTTFSTPTQPTKPVEATKSNQIIPPPPAVDNSSDALGSASGAMGGATIDDDFDTADIEVVGGPDTTQTPPSIKVLAKKAGKGSNKAVGVVDDEQAEDGDIFGRGTGINAVKKTESQKKYVTLNPETAFGPEVITSFDFPNVTLSDLTKHMQSLTGINLILDKELKGNISIMAPTPITVGDAWKAYLAALNINGYAIVKSGAFYKIVNARDIRGIPTSTYTGNYTPDTENYVMRILPLKYINAVETARAFRAFNSRYGRISELAQTNSLIIQDTGDNVNRIVRLIKFLDIPGYEESLQIIKVKNTSAQEISKLLDQILKESGSTKKRNVPGQANSTATISKIIAEPRTNSIIAMANAEGATQLKDLIFKLDVKLVSTGSGQIHVYYLNYGNADDLSKTLTALISGASSRTTSRFSGPGAVAPEATVFNSDVKITSDKANNALVINAAPTDYLTLKEVIKKLDIPRDQVYVEGLIMETNVDKARGFGISIIGAYGSGAAQAGGFTGGSSDLMNLIAGNITSLGGLFVGGGTGPRVTKTVGGQSITINSINHLITAVATDNNTNVLATPQLLILDNTQGVFEVGETVPTPEKSTAANGSTSVSLKEQKVAMTLKITPQINKVTRFVKLDIDQKIEDFSERQLPDGLKNEGIATTTRSTVTTVVARDKDTIAMGGLMRDKEVTTENKVPGLGDIPLLGWLFKHWTKKQTKVNILFFLTPRIIASYDKAQPANMKDVLNRRANHLKDTVGEDDPFGSTVKGLYEKAKKQEAGPLYDPEEASKFKLENEKIENEGPEEIIPKTEETTSAKNDPLAPNYQEIMKQVEETKKQ